MTNLERQDGGNAQEVGGVQSINQTELGLRAKEQDFEA